MNELVSVAIPAFNAADRIPIALGSLLCQNYENWEALVIDDGSIDETESVVNECKDSRIRYYRVVENKGRPHAREMALRQARGQFLAMLDADDWWYPEKLAEQMRVFEMRPSLALVSTGLAITNENDQIVGVRSLGKQSQKWPRSQMMVKPTVPRVAHAPSVLRMNLAQESGYDLNYSVAEDVDFLINILNGNEFTVVPRPLYAYSEAVSLDSKNIVNANKNVGKILGKYFRNYKFWIGKQIIENYLKGIAYRILFTTGLTDWTVARRSRKPDASESQGFVLARESVFGAVKRHWPGFVGVND